MVEANIIEITTTFKGFGFGIVYRWRTLCVTLGIVSIVINFSQKKTGGNKWLSYKHC